jgi:hypothetical protein
VQLFLFFGADFFMNVSVVIPTFDRRHLVGEAIDSALAQADEGMELEVIVVDDRSSDDTVPWLTARYGHDARVRVLINERAKGPAGARNTGILAARCPYVAFLDSDDVYLPGHLSMAARLFEAHPHVGLVFGRTRYERDGAEILHVGAVFERNIQRAPKVAENEQAIIFAKDFFAHILEAGCYFGLATVVLRADAARELMTESLRVAEDFEFYARLSRKVVFACLKAPQILGRRQGDNVSSDSAGSMAPMDAQACAMIMAYPGLSPHERRLICRRMAKTLFDWAWWCRENGRIGAALRLHLQSIRHGLAMRNLIAMAKLPLALLRKAFGMAGGQGR